MRRGNIVDPSRSQATKILMYMGVGKVEDLLHCHSLSHIGLDFVTGLPILKILDRFRKMTHLVPLQKAKETAKLLIQNVFRLLGFPWIWFGTGGHSFHLYSELTSASWWGPPSIWIRVAWSPGTLHRDPLSWHGWRVRTQLLAWLGGLSALPPFQCVYSYQPLLFLSLNGSVSCASALDFSQRSTNVGSSSGHPPPPLSEPLHRQGQSPPDSCTGVPGGTEVEALQLVPAHPDGVQELAFCV